MTARVRIHNLIEIITERKKLEAKGVRQSMYEACRSISIDLGDDIAGFAIVVWGSDGELRSAYDPGRGPIKAALIPTLAGDALNRHVALDMASPVRLK